MITSTRFRPRQGHSLSLCLLLGCLLLSAIPQAQSLHYAKAFNNTVILGDNVYGHTITRDAAGNLYVAGSFGGVADFDGGPGVANLISAGPSDAFIAKYDANGNYLWARRIGSAGEEQIRTIALDPSGNICVGGSIIGTSDLDPGPGVASFSSFSNAADAFVGKYDPTGNYLWAKVMGGASSEYTYRVIADGAGNMYATGSYSGSDINFNAGGTAAMLTSAGSTDIFLVKYSHTGNCIFANSMGGSWADIPNSMTVDASGNLYLTGAFSTTADFNPGAGVANLTSANGYNGFFAKYDAAGNYVWAKGLLGSGIAWGYGIAVDGSGNAYVTGYLSGTADFDPGAGVVNMTSASNDAFLCKYDASGNYSWAKLIGGASNESGSSLVLDASNNIYLTGYFSGTTDFDPNAGVANLVSAGGNDAFVAKYTSAGAYVWAKALGGTANDAGSTVMLDASNNIFTSGYFAGTADFDPGAGVANLSVGGTNANSFVSKLSNTGSYLRADQIGGYANGTAMSEQAKSIATDAAGNTYITGYFAGTVDFDPGAGVAAITSAGGNDVFVAKYDASGAYLWARAVGGTGADGGVFITLDASGNSYITGTFSATADFDPGAGVVNLTTAGGTDIFVLKLDAAGNFGWAKAIGGASVENSNGVTVDGAGNVFITGNFLGTVDFDPGAGVVNLTATGAFDIFLAKYDASGNYLWAKMVGASSSEYSNGIALDGSGAIYITGYFSGTVDFDPGAAVTNLVSAGSNDAFIASYDAAGNYVWAKAIGGANVEMSYGIAVDGSNNVYITGTYAGTPDLDPGAGTATLANAGSYDVFVAKYDASGNYVWANGIGGTSNDMGYAITVDGSSNVYVTGYFAGTADFDPGTGTVNLTSTGGADIFLGKYNASGNYVYAKAMGGPSTDYGYGVAVDGSGRAYVTGYFNSVADFDPANGSSSAFISSLNSSDFFLARFGPVNTMPVRLQNFTASLVKKGETVQLNWTTATEKDNDYFIVERSRDGLTFEAIGKVKGCLSCSNLQQYSFSDEQPANGRSYYRLKQVDTDGQSTFSQLVAVTRTNEAKITVRLFPNVTSDVFEVVIKNDDVKKQALVQLVSAAGQVIKEQSVMLNEGINKLQLNASNQGAGIYYVTVSGGEGRMRATVTLIKK